MNTPTQSQEHSAERRAALLVLRQELEDSIDGGEECRGHDKRISGWIDLVDMALGNAVDPWARLFWEPEMRDAKETT